jgi:low affinity Fe/Cu permease
MTTAKKELFETIELIPDVIANELLNYADYLTSKYFEKKMPDRVMIKDNEDLKIKLNERIQSMESGKVKMLTIDEAFEEIDKV